MHFLNFLNLFTFFFIPQYFSSTFFIFISSLLCFQYFFGGIFAYIPITVLSILFPRHNVFLSFMHQKKMVLFSSRNLFYFILMYVLHLFFFAYIFFHFLMFNILIFFLFLYLFSYLTYIFLNFLFFYI